MQIKPGVSIVGIRPETVVGMVVVDSVYLKHGTELVLTSITEGKHKTYSLHYVGLAMDTRTRDFKKEDLHDVVADLRASLGEEFDVLLEGDHIHIEFQPMNGVNL